MEFPDKIAFLVGPGDQCGFGDLLMWYYGKRSSRSAFGVSGRLEAFKKANPNIKLKLILSCHNPKAYELFDYVPYIDEVEQPVWKGITLGQRYMGINVVNGWTLAKKNSELLGEVLKYPYKQPIVYLSKQDTDFLAPYIKNPYILIHPFSSNIDRMNLSHDGFLKLIKKIASNFNINIIVVGGTYTRGPMFKGKKLTSPKKITENFACKGIPRVVNLVNKTNLRMATFLAERSTFFVGTRSFCACVARETGKPSVLLCGKGGALEARIKMKDGRWHKNCLPIAINKKDSNRLSYEVISFLKHYI